MRILHVNKDYPPHIGGIERYVADLAHEQSRLGHEVTVLAVNSVAHERIEEDERIKVIRVARFAHVSSSPIGFGLVTWLKRTSPDIVHLHHPFPTGELAYLAHSQTPAVMTWHSDIVRQRVLISLYKPFLNQVLRRVHLVMPTSENYLDSSPFLKRFRFKCRVVPLGIDSADYVATPAIARRAAELRAQTGGVRVLCVGRLVPYKGVEYLIRAMPMVDRAASLLIVGEGPQERRLRTLVHELRCDSRIHFTSSVDQSELVALYHAADLFVLPSIDRNEAFGLVQVEAMACGLPVVSTSLPTGVSFVNVDGQTGLTVRPRDPEALAAAINDRVRSSDLWRARSINAKNRVAMNFTIQRSASGVSAGYEFALNNEGLSRLTKDLN